MNDMTTDEAFKTIMRQSPCQHENADTRLGDGKTWARCEDCGSVFPQDSSKRHDLSTKFDDAIEHLRTGLDALRQDRDDWKAATDRALNAVAEVRKAVGIDHCLTDELLAHCEALRRDAERWRWARAHPIVLDDFAYHIDAEVEEFVDAAMAATQPKD